MLGGIIFQLSACFSHLEGDLPDCFGLNTVAITVYAIFATEFLVRYAKDTPIRDREGLSKRRMPFNTRLMVVGLYASTLFVYIRYACSSFLLL